MDSPLKTAAASENASPSDPWSGAARVEPADPVSQHAVARRADRADAQRRLRRIRHDRRPRDVPVPRRTRHQSWPPHRTDIDRIGPRAAGARRPAPAGWSSAPAPSGSPSWHGCTCSASAPWDFTRLTESRSATLSEAPGAHATLRIAGLTGSSAPGCVLQREARVVQHVLVVSNNHLTGATLSVAFARRARAIIEGMVRTLNLREWAGLWVAIDSDGRVRLSSEDVEQVISEIERLELDGLEIVRAPIPGEPVVFGLG